MRFANVSSAQPSVMDAEIVGIEADISRGLYAFSIVGLASKAVAEAKDRMSAAIKNTGFPSPKSKNHKVIISLSPADLKKEGPLYDLPIAIAYLIASGNIAPSVQHRIKDTLFVGELSLDGQLRPVHGVLPITATARKQKFKNIIVPKENVREAALIPDIAVIGANSLQEVLDHIDIKRPSHNLLAPEPKTKPLTNWKDAPILLDDIKGQSTAKRGLIISAAGRHNILLVGPPGTGKSMLSKAFVSILPPLTQEESLEVTSIHSVAGILESPVVTTPPFRDPHHTASHTSLVGGGTHPKPGEVTLAHRGVLFLDEFPEFERRSIDALRQPLEDRMVSISRVKGSACFPADFILLAAMNPHRGTDEGDDEETYADLMLETYKKKISGPIMDRIDLWLPVPHVAYEDLTAKKTKTREETKLARAQIQNAREKQKERLKKSSARSNAEMSSRDIEECVELTTNVTTLLNDAAQKLNLSPRSYHRVIKVSQTIADLEDAKEITESHILEALSYRPKL